MRREQEIQKAVFAHLRQRGAQERVRVSSGKRRLSHGLSRRRFFKAMGVVPGTPDVICIKDGQVFGLELKAEGGKLSEAQRATIEAMRVAGAVVEVATGIDQALAALEGWGLLRGRVQ